MIRYTMSSVFLYFLLLFRIFNSHYMYNDTLMTIFTHMKMTTITHMQSYSAGFALIVK